MDIESSSERDARLENDENEDETATTIDIPITEQVVRHYYQQYKNYTYIYSGLQFGCHLVLYTNHPDQVHSDYAIYILPSSYVCVYDTTGGIPWYTIQTLVRMMADLHKTLILVHVGEVESNSNDEATIANGNSVRVPYQGKEYWLDEFAITTEHAPFRHTVQKQRFQQLSSNRHLIATEIVGTQSKKKAKTLPQSIPSQKSDVASEEEDTQSSSPV